MLNSFINLLSNEYWFCILIGAFIVALTLSIYSWMQVIKHRKAQKIEQENNKAKRQIQRAIKRKIEQERLESFNEVASDVLVWNAIRGGDNA